MRVIVRADDGELLDAVEVSDFAAMDTPDGGARLMFRLDRAWRDETMMGVRAQPDQRPLEAPARGISGR